MEERDEYFHEFREDNSGVILPERFTYPFYYVPHTLARKAAEQLQEYLEELSVKLDHNFGLVPGKEGLVIGKMFGVLVVENQQGKLGFLSAFSGKLADSNTHKGFVPPIFDMLEKDGFFRKEEEVLNALNREIELLETSEYLKELQEILEQTIEKRDRKLKEIKGELRAAKRRRDQRRKEIQELSEITRKEIEEELRQESIRGHYTLKDQTQYWKREIEKSEKKVDDFLQEIEMLKKERRERSSQLQKQLFEQYNFLNGYGETKNVIDIFLPTAAGTPPAGTGECAAPKLIQYAFEKGYRPVCMAEFWWGASPKSEVRVHGNYYPACRSKCEPVLGYMLEGVKTEPNPMLENPAEGKELEIVFEDEYLVVINKPHEFLSVPGKTIRDSVLTRLQVRYPDATGPLLVHRLDMSTSGILLAAKTERVHKHLQSQFIRRKVEKRYVALLEGEINEEQGEIELPLRVDLDNRPHQLVCYEYGKHALTRYKVLERKNNVTRIHFFPVTGRTHQLRVHAAHSSGLGAPIVGDDLYGTRSERLCLHAEWIRFVHPVTKEVKEIEVAPDF